MGKIWTQNLKLLALIAVNFSKLNEKNLSRSFGFERDFFMRLIKIGRTWIRTMDLHIISVAL